MDSFGRSDVGHAASALTRITIAAAVALPATTVLAETLTAREIMHRVEDRDAGDDGRRASGQGHAPHPQVPPRYQIGDATIEPSTRKQGRADTTVAGSSPVRPAISA